MRKAYQELFDGVHASGKLRTEVMDMKHTENTSRNPRRRIPTAALAAAVLAAALAGTALAAELGSWLKMEAIHPNEEGVSIEGLHVTANFTPISLEDLSGDILRRAAESEEAYFTVYFDTREAAADFMGLELARNGVLGGLQQDGEVTSGGLALMGETGMAPAALSICTHYKGKAYEVTETAYWEVDTPEFAEYVGRAPGQWDDVSSVGATGEYYAEDVQYSLREYTTPGGLTAAIVQRSGVQKPFRHGPVFDLRCTTAYFVKDSSYYSLSCKMDSFDDEMAMITGILDAYE